MGLKAVYAAGGGVAAFVIAVFVVYGTGTHTSSNISQTNTTAMPLTLSIKDIVPKQINNHLANIQVIFNATNPNRGSAILESIAYDMLIDGKRIVSGTIGTRLEGFLSSSAGIYPIIGGGSVILKDNQLFQRSNSTAGTWNEVVGGKANYVITGTMSYRQISSLQATSTDMNFRLVFP
jgi:hypothetical protein